jgi:hypothetical protein
MHVEMHSKVESALNIHQPDTCESMSERERSWEIKFIFIEMLRWFRDVNIV